MIVAITGAKGGTGKSSLTFLLYEELIEQGYKVAVMDLDGQQNLTKDMQALSVETRKKEDIMNLREIEKDYDFILMDCHPAMDKITALAFYMADYLIVLSKPDRHIFDTYDRTAKQLELSHNKAKVIHIMTMYQKGKTLHRKLFEAVQGQYKEVITIPSSVTWEEAFFFHDRLPKKSPCREPLEQIIKMIKEN